MRVRAVAVAATLIAAAACSRSGEFGRFVGTVKTEWIESGRKMRLLEDFKYVDAKGGEWIAPKDSVIDGASIPRVLWSVVGSPYTGEYRDASVVHDVACDRREKPWQEVHRMFYEACRSGGVADEKAKLMYAAVYHFGPRWTPGGAIIAFHRVMPVEDEFAQLKSYVEDRNPSLEEIEAFSATRTPVP